ncbi:MAG: ATP-binding protein [Peptococcales bacterium]|jgi:MinD superfamily P-loop ATPase
MKIAIASGKGGTGKTTIASNLASYLSSHGSDVTLVDCDVEEPNNHIFFQPKWHNSFQVQMPVPDVDASKCIGCGKCSEFCEFNAIVNVNNSILIFPELCHGCGGCFMICPTQALKETARGIGEVQQGIKNNLKIVHGVMRIGEAMSPPLIKKVKEHGSQSEISIIDCPPGTSCPMIQAVRGADFVLLVTEPTPFGLSDLKLAVETLRQLNLPFAVGVNRFEERGRTSLGDKPSKSKEYPHETIHDYCKKEEIPIILEIPEDRAIAQAYSQGKIFLEYLPHYENLFQNLMADLEVLIC